MKSFYLLVVILLSFAISPLIANEEFPMELDWSVDVGANITAIGNQWVDEDGNWNIIVAKRDHAIIVNKNGIGWSSDTLEMTRNGQITAVSLMNFEESIEAIICISDELEEYPFEKITIVYRFYGDDMRDYDSSLYQRGRVSATLYHTTYDSSIVRNVIPFPKNHINNSITLSFYSYYSRLGQNSSQYYSTKGISQVYSLLDMDFHNDITTNSLLIDYELMTLNGEEVMICIQNNSSYSSLWDERYQSEFTISIVNEEGDVLNTKNIAMLDYISTWQRRRYQRFMNCMEVFDHPEYGTVAAVSYSDTTNHYVRLFSIPDLEDVSEPVVSFVHFLEHVRYSEEENDAGMLLGFNSKYQFAEVIDLNEMAVAKHYNFPIAEARMITVGKFEQDNEEDDAYQMPVVVNNTVQMYRILHNPLKTESKSSLTIPTEFSLHSLYPNPFNSSTLIRFDLPTASEVKLSVIDINGRLLTSLLNGNVSAGSHAITWDATGFATGTYFMKLETANGVKFVQKAVMLR